MKRLSLFLLIILLFGVSCQKRAQYDFPIPEAIQGFSFAVSRDTIRFDTIASEVLSSTEKLVIYNPSDKSILFSKLSLRGGKERGFYINLNGNFGESFEGVSIAPRDSIYLFARVCLPRGAEAEATLVQDSLEIHDPNGAVALLPLEAVRQNVVHYETLQIVDKSVYNSAEPLFIRDSLIVEEGASLTLQSPVQVWFSDKAYMRVKGQLIVKGEAEKPVRFCGTRWDKFLPKVSYRLVTAQWGGVYLDEKASLEADYLTLLNARWGLVFAPRIEARVSSYTAQIRHCKLHNIKGVGIRAEQGRFLIEDSQISNTLGSCLYLAGGDYTIRRSSILNFYPWPDIRQKKALYYQDFSKQEDKETSSSLRIEHSIIDGDKPVLASEGGELELNLSIQKQNNNGSIELNHCFLHSLVLEETTKLKLQNIIYRDGKSPAPYQYLGRNEKDELDYNFNFRPKSLAPFINKGLSGTEYQDLDGYPRSEKMTYGCYRGTF